MDQRIAFARSKDGTNIAYALSGDGPPLVRAGTWLTHVHHDWESPVWKHWLRFMSCGHTLVRYDPRGCGLSQNHVEKITFDHWVDDLEAVVDHLELETFPLFGMSQGAAVAAEYAIRHPERVSRLILYAPLLTGWRGRTGVYSLRWQAMQELVLTGRGEPQMMFPTMFANLFLPQSAPETRRWYADLQRKSASKHVANQFLNVLAELSVFPRMQLIRVPTLVMQIAREDVVNPDNAVGISNAIPNCELVSIDSFNHILLEDEPGWEQFKQAFARYLGTDVSRSAVDLDRLSHREREVLDRIAAGLSNRDIANALHISEKTVRNHVTKIFEKLGVSSRTQAMLRAAPGIKA